MTAQVARLALPFTDADMATANVRIENTTTVTLFTITVALPSVDGVSGGYYNGGDLAGGTTVTYATPNESLVMAFGNAIETSGILERFSLEITEDPLLPGRYVFERPDAGAWKILWDDALTTMPSQWLGFDEVTYTSTASVITAPWQSDRLWRATRPTWNRQREHKKTSLAMTWSGGVSTRQLSDIRIEWQLKYSAQVGARVYKHDGTIQTLVDVVPGMALGDPNIALESLWQWIAARTPVEYWADEDDLTSSVYLRPRDAQMLDGVIRNINAERSSAPPVYDIVMEFVTSSAGAVGTGGGGVICPPATAASPAQYDTYALLPTTGTEGDWSEVTTTGAAGAYRWMESLGGVVVKAQLPSDLYRRALNGTGFLQNGGGDDHSWLSANAGGPNTAAALPAVGWVDASSGSGTITDVGGDTQLDAPTGGGLADMNFATNWPDGQVLVIAQFDVPTGVSTFSATVDMAESNIIRRLSWAHAAVKNDVSFTGAPVGGPVSITNFGIVFGVMQQGTAAAEDTDLAFLWDSNAGWVKAEGVQQNSATGIAFGTPDAARFFSQFATSASRLLLRRWQVIDLGQ